MVAIVSLWKNTGKENKNLADIYKSYDDVDDVSIWLVTDTHYIAKNLTDFGEYFDKMVKNGDGKYMYGCEEITDAFVDEVTEACPDALIVSGDLTFNGAKESHIAFAKKLQTIKDAGINVIALPGNHDFTVKRAAKFSGDAYELVESIDASQYLTIYGDFGINEAIARDDTSLSYVSEISPNLRVLVVDVNTVPGMSGILTNATLEFVENQLIDAQNNHAYVIGVTHQTLLTHSELTSQGMIFINNDKLLALYEKYDVLMNLSGHMHIQHIKESENGFVEIATGALMTSPNYHGQIEIKNRQLTYKAVPSLEEDTELSKAAKEFLWNNAYRQAEELIPDHKELESMAGFFADFNVNYIAGRSDLINWETELMDKWEETDTFVPVYLKVVQDEMAETEGTRFTEYKMKW